MEDVSEFFKSGFLGLYKNTIGKNFQHKTLRDRVNNFHNMRRETRSTLIFQKRQIDENMTPINTPEPSKTIKIVEKKNTSNKRLEMLQKWKLEKEKRKQEERKKAKPLFKVCHVPNEIGLPNLDVNKQIKGKSIKVNVSQSQSQFAPPNHKFHAPKAIQPIHMNSVNNLSVNSKTNLFKVNTLSNSVAEESRVSRKEGIVSQRNVRATSRHQCLEKHNVTENRNSAYKTSNNKKTVKSTNSKQKTTNFKIESKNVKSKTRETTRQNIEMESIPSTSISDTKTKQYPGKKRLHVATKFKVGENKDKSLSNAKNISYQNKFIDVKSNRKEPLKEKSELDMSLKLSRKPVAKTVEWSCIEIIGRDSPVNNVNIKTPKGITKKYNKTPRKEYKRDMSDVELIDESQSISKYVTRQLRRGNSNPELKELDQLEQKESNTNSQDSTIGFATGSASPDYPLDTNADVFYTPQKNNVCEDSSAYISPFVTVSRGKSSARKEYHLRQSTGKLTPEFGVDILTNTSPQVGADYFLKKLNNEINRIEEVCDVWETYKNSNELPEEANDIIDVAIGQSKLLISKKFEQFRNLIKQCKESQYVEKPISCEDLHGFWDMIYMQVEDLNKRFNNLNVLKGNNWQEIIPERKTVVKRGRGRPKKASASTALKNLIKAAREMNKVKTEDEINLKVPEIVETKHFDGGYYSVKSPVRIPNGPHLTNENTRRSLRVSLLTNQAKNRISSSPGLTMMKISQAIKCGDTMTPSKSILKNDLTKSEKRITKSVLFRDNIEEDIETNSVRVTEKRCDSEDMEHKVNNENNINEINLISFSPVTPIRRSKRLNKMK